MFRRDSLEHFITKYEKAHARSLRDLEKIAAELDTQAHLFKVTTEDASVADELSGDLIERGWLGYESALYAARQLRKILG